MINSEKIKARAKQFGIRQQDLAKAMGIRQSTVNQKINNVRPMYLDEAEAMARVLKISNAEFASYFFSADTEVGGKMVKATCEETRGLMSGRTVRETSEDDGGRLSICVEFRGTPEELKKGKRIIRRTMYRLRAAGVLVFGTAVVRRTGEIRNIVFYTARPKSDT